ncbi:carbohydrate ABC transporter permease [Paenibacillus cremeus]|uniref:Carbohydrate ABC transporter permease n=1 Tax=Paenibacillus cremeus TaxID=2163881 RepID=A0A559K7R5_9BACL|nr:carbohydrate ABC transporter permease [Paenibacillus cremeus]TVY08175.1 carbohydrate ABC transporter permease [Paenibacillus cremeus]
MNRKKGWVTPLSVLICLIHILPFYILITTSFKAMDDLSSKWMFPGYLYLDNFINAWYDAKLGIAFKNNLIVAVTSIVFIVIVGSIAAYPLSRRQTKWNKFIYMLFISALIVPPLTSLVPLYKFMVDLGGMNQYWGIILLHISFHLPMTIFLYTGFISTIPKELDEAGMIDGAGHFGLFYRIILPLLKPITATVVILHGVSVWNDFQFSLFFLQKPELRTVTVALSSFFGEDGNKVGWVAAGSFMGALPMIVIYLFLQRYFITGLSAGAIKG